MSAQGKEAAHQMQVHVAAETSKPQSKIIKTDISSYLSGGFDVSALDGLRAIASFTVIAFHALLYWGTLLPLNMGYKVLDKSLPLRLAMQGPIGVDLFLVLTGMWATAHLVPALELASLFDNVRGSLWRAVRRYYNKRARRVLPRYVTALLMVAFAIDHTKTADPALRHNHDTVFEYCPGSLPLNFVLLNNIIGFGGCGVHFWSLAVQLQFYLLFPLCLLLASPSRPGFRRRVAVGALAAFFITSMMRYAVAHAVGVRLPLPAYAHPELRPEEGDYAMRYYHNFYFSSSGRVANLATGVLLGLCMLDTRIVTSMKTRRSLSLIFLASTGIFVAFGHIVLKAKLYGHPKEQAAWHHAQAFAALAYHGSPLFCAVSAAIILCIALHAGPFFSAAAWVLSSPPLRHFAKVSYDMYLLHMPALYWWEAYTLPRGALEARVSADPLIGFGTILGGTYAAGYLVSLLHYGLHAKMRSTFAGFKKNKPLQQVAPKAQ